jgi:hypothetical protein
LVSGGVFGDKDEFAAFGEFDACSGEGLDSLLGAFFGEFHAASEGKPVDAGDRGESGGGG